MLSRNHKDIYPKALFFGVMALYIAMVHPEYCKEVYEEFVHCNSSSDFRVSCPESHRIDINFAYPMQLQPGEECINDVHVTEGACRLESLGYYYSSLCSGQQTCLIQADSWNRLEKVSCLHGGIKMMHMRYRCILGTTSVSILNMCNVDVTATSYVRLTSSAYEDMIPSTTGLDPSRTFYSSPCTCRMTLPGYTQMQMSRINFWKSELGYTCDQRVVIETPARAIVAVFCSSQKIHQFLSCDVNWRDYVIRFETKEPSVNTSFVIDFSVFHEVGFQFECGVNMRTPDLSSSSSTTTTTTTTTASTTEATTTAITPSTTTAAVTTTLIMTTPTTETTTTPKLPPPLKLEPKPVPPKVVPTTEVIPTTSDFVSPTTRLLPSQDSTPISTTKLALAPIDENDVNNIVESSDVRIDNTRASKDDTKDNGISKGDEHDNLLLPIEAIIGIAVGGVMLIVLMIIMASCFARNKKIQSTTTEQVNLDLSFRDDPIYEEPKYYATSYDNPDLYPDGKKSFRAIPPGLPPRNSNHYAEPPSSTSSGSLRRSRFDDFPSRSMDSVATVSSAPYLSAKKIPLPSHPHVSQAFAPNPPLPMRWSPPSHVALPTHFQTSTLPTERHFAMAPGPSQLMGMRTTPTPRKDRGKSPAPQTKPKPTQLPTQLPTKRAMSSDRHMNTALPPQRHYKQYIEPVFSATAPDRGRQHDRKKRYKTQQSASPPRVRFQENLNQRHLPDVLPPGTDPLFGRDSHDTFFAY